MSFVSSVGQISFPNQGGTILDPLDYPGYIPPEPTIPEYVPEEEQVLEKESAMSSIYSSIQEIGTTIGQKAMSITSYVSKRSPIGRPSRPTPPALPQVASTAFGYLGMLYAPISSYRALKNAEKEEDGEGIRQHSALFSQGVLSILGTISYVVSDVVHHPVIHQGLQCLANSAFCGVSLLGMIASISEIKRCENFANELEKCGSIDESENLEKALNFLKNQDKTELPSKAISLLIEKANVDQILIDLKSPDKKQTGIEKGKKLIKEVLKENRDKEINSSISLALSFIAFSVLIVSVVSGGTVPALAALVASIISFAYMLIRLIEHMRDKKAAAEI